MKLTTTIVLEAEELFLLSGLQNLTPWYQVRFHKKNNWRLLLHSGRPEIQAKMKLAMALQDVMPLNHE